MGSILEKAHSELQFSGGYPSTVNLYDTGRNSHNGRTVGHIFGYHGIGANFHTIANADCAKNFGTGTDKNVIPQHRSLLFLGSDRDLVFNENVAAGTHGTIDDDPLAVDQNQGRSERGTPANDALTKHHVKFVAHHCERSETATLTGLHQPVHQHRKRAIGQQGLADVLGSNGRVQPLRLGAQVGSQQSHKARAIPDLRIRRCHSVTTNRLRIRSAVLPSQNSGHFESKS